MNTDPELWRKWLDDPAISRDTTEPTTGRRRGARTRPAPTADTKLGRSRVAVVAVAAAAALGGAAVAAIVLTGSGAGRGTDTARPYAVITTAPTISSAAATTAVPSPFCTPGVVSGAIITNLAGDRATGPGVIAAYEHAFFADRDAKKALDVTDRGVGLPSESGLAQGIADVPVGAPWCVSITDLGGNVFETSVKYLPATGAQPVLWLLHITVAANNGTYTIVRVEDKAA
ncbi:hypothetical protein ACIRRA_39875 [Nocardia sp. NPDC101769]|uniref:hypothetical protein n=1 Tax=Nocardia sp. NPDC101769 TaxID=3364333 RepID=UPI00382166BB